MKILQLNTKYSSGGAAAIARSLHINLNNTNKYQSTFLFGRGPSDDVSSMKITHNSQVLFSALSNRLLGKSINVGLNNNLVKLIESYDIIHLHNIHGYYLDYKKLINLLVYYNKKVVWTFHDLWPITGRCAPPNECNKWKNGCGSCPFKDIYPKTYIDKSFDLWNEKKDLFNLLSKDRTIIVTPSQWLKNMVEQSYMGGFKTEVIPNGIKTGLYNKTKEECRKELGLPLDKKLLLFVAADINDERKGIKYILDLMNEFDKNIVFVSVGKSLKNLNINENKLIQFGYIEDKRTLNKIYRASDLYVNPTLGETFSLTTAEAFSNGTPTVAFDVGPISELIYPNCGALVEKGNLSELMRKIDQLLNNEKTLEKLSSNCFDKYNNNYTIDKFMSRYIDIYEEL